jgi:hypothetical protein
MQIRLTTVKKTESHGRELVEIIQDRQVIRLTFEEARAVANAVWLALDSPGEQTEEITHDLDPSPAFPVSRRAL